MARWSGAFTRALLVGTESTQWKYHDPANSYWTAVEECYTLMSTGESSLSGLASQALNYVYYFQPDHVLSKLNEWLADPGVHDAFTANRIAQFESLFHMSPEEMDNHSAHEQASNTCSATLWISMRK